MKLCWWKFYGQKIHGWKAGLSWNKSSSKRLWLLEGKSRGVMAFNIEPDIIPSPYIYSLNQNNKRVVLGRLSICQWSSARLEGSLNFERASFLKVQRTIKSRERERERERETWKMWTLQFDKVDGLGNRIKWTWQNIQANIIS